MNDRSHWEKVYSTKATDSLGWYTPHLDVSISWIQELHLRSEVPIIDVGCGASTFLDDLLRLGHRNLTGVDISLKALEIAKSKFGANAERISWIIGDITTVNLPAHYYDLWHDRAVFHFLTKSEGQKLYRNVLTKALKADGLVIMGTFAPEAPANCSGLPVRRYDAELLKNTLGSGFQLLRHQKALHVTPRGVEQMYSYCLFQRKI